MGKAFLQRICLWTAHPRPPGIQGEYPMTEKIENKSKTKAEAFQIGLTVLILLGSLTVGEYFLGSIAPVWAAPLWGIALIKAFFIVREYMHLSRLFAEGEEVHE
jgi:hypothetical protein